MQMYDNQFVATSFPRKNEYSVGLFAWMVRTVVAVLLLSTGVQAAYKPVDISDITGEKGKALAELTADLKRMPPVSRDAYICEQLGLVYCKDYSSAMFVREGYPATKRKAYFVGRGGKPMQWWCWWPEAAKAANAAHERWDKCYNATKQFKAEVVLVPFKKEIQKVVCNTAKYLLETMPKEHRWLTLALMGKMVYNDQGLFNCERIDWRMENRLIAKTPRNEGSGYVFMSPEGRECDIRVILAADNKDWRWRQVVWRCENLVGSKDILALFPEEVEAMRKHYRGREARLKDEAKAKNDALLAGADEAMSSLPKEKRLARIALAVGLYYLDHREAGYADGHLNPSVTIIMPDGSKHSGEEFVDEAPGLLQQVPHEAILEYYRQPIEQMARAVAKDRFGKLPAAVRDLLRAQLSRQLTKLNDTPAKIEEGLSTIQTFDRTWQVPTDAVDHQNTYFKNSEGSNISYSIIDKYQWDYGQTFRLVNLCARILGNEATADLIPSGDVETENEVAREGTSTPRDKLLTQGRTALREMPVEQRYAWLAEKMGFCFTEDGESAYQPERTANGNAVYVDAQGEVCKLTDAPGKNSPEWTEVTNTALAMGYDQLTTPYKEELKQLAVQTSKHILTSMPSELRQTWLAERNKFFFMSNAGNLCSGYDCTLESGVKISFQGTGDNYRKCMYYDPSGKIMPTAAAENVWSKRWALLYYCEIVAGIDAINAQFPAEVEPMRTAFQKSPFYKK